MKKSIKKRLPKVIAFLLILALLLPIAATYAKTDNDLDPDADTGDSGVESKDIQDIIDFLATLLKYFSALGGIVVVGALMYNGYRLSYSVDPRGKAEAIDGLKNAIIGGVVAFGSYQLAGFLKGLADKL